MRDSEVVASIVAGDALGLAAAYDRYAEPLYQYCRTLLADPADAADAVQDTFVIAAARLDGLRDPHRLRPWLYAVARNEARRILRAKKGTSALGEAPDMTDACGDVSADAERADLRALLEDAAAGLNPGERELIELQLRQQLEPAEVATVLGISRNHAHALLSRAREQLETCLAALLVGRAGRGECGELDAMLDGWDGRLTILLRKRVHRHIEQCATCTASRARELRPAMLLDLSPGAALAAGAAISLRLAPGAPEGLRAHTITLATGQGPGAVAHRAAVLSRAGAFTRGGFPQPAHGAGAALAAHGGVRGALRSSPRRAATVAGVVVIAAIIAAVAFALAGGTQTGRPAAGPTPPPRLAAASPAAALTSPSESPSGGTIELQPDGAPGQIDLSGSGSGDWQVTWSLTVANDPFNIVSVSPVSGFLTSAGSTAVVTVRAHWLVPCGLPQAPTITVSPGGAVFTVCTGHSRRFSGDGGFALAIDDAVYARAPGRESPGEHRAAPLPRLTVSGHYGRVL